MWHATLTGCVGRCMAGASAKFNVHAAKRWAAIARKIALSCTLKRDQNPGLPQQRGKEREEEMTEKGQEVKVLKKGKGPRIEEIPLHIQELIGSQTVTGSRIKIVQRNQRRKKKMKENIWRLWRKPSRSRRKLKKEKEQEVLEE